MVTRSAPTGAMYFTLPESGIPAQYVSPRTRRQLQEWLKMLFGLVVPDTAVCPGHCSPLDAAVASYFALAPVVVWKASRGFGGKTSLLAAISVLELMDGADVSLLGGSGRQSQQILNNVRQAWNRGGQIQGEDTQSPLSTLIPDEPSSYRARTINGNELVALTASTKSARGPHPQRLRMDECIFGDNYLETPNGSVRLKDAQVGGLTWSWDNGLVTGVVTDKKYKGERAVLRVEFEDGTSVTCTPEHLFLTQEGWKSADNLRQDLHRMQQPVGGCFEGTKEPYRLMFDMLSQADNVTSETLSGLWGKGCSSFNYLQTLLWEEKSLKKDLLRRLPETSQAALIPLSCLSSSKYAWKFNPRQNDAREAGKADAIQGGATSQRIAGLFGYRLGGQCTLPKVFDRLGYPGLESSYRSERRVPSSAASECGKRSKENVRIEGSRLQDVGIVGGSDAPMVLSISGSVRVRSVEPDGYKDVWDISVSGYHTFLCEGKVVHNCDEMRMEVYEAAMGQAMDKDGITSQTTLSSTHQYPDGTMTEILKQAAEMGWDTYEWCWRESSVSNNGWLSTKQVEDKKASVPGTMWQIEYDLQEPNPEGRLFTAESLLSLFNGKVGTVEDRLRSYYEFEKPKEGALYSTGADWARDLHFCVITTLRYDVSPARLVAYERRQHEPYPLLVDRFEKRLERYPGKGIHDAIGVGASLSDYIAVDDVIDYNTKSREILFSPYVLAVEAGKIQSPVVNVLHTEHKYCRYMDIFGSGHPPDGMVAMALAWLACTGKAEEIQNKGKPKRGRIGKAWAG